MRIFVMVVTLISIIATGCTRSTASGNVSTPPMVTLGTSMITQDKSLISPTRIMTQPTITLTPKPLPTNSPRKPTPTHGTTKQQVVTSIPVTPSPFKGTPPPTPTTKIPMDVPVKIWKDIPIMPGAVTGDEADDRYRFMLTAKTDQVRDFYKTELPKLGWKFDTQGTGENGAPIFIFTKGGTILSVSVIVLGDIVIVTLAPI